MPTATGAASFLGLCGDAWNENKTQGEAKTTPTCNAPHQQDQRNGDTPAAPPTHPTTRSIGSIQFQSNRTRSLPCPAAAASQVVEWRWRIDMEFLAEKSKSKSPGEQGICSARPLSVLSLSCSFSGAAADRVTTRRQQPVSHTPRKAGAGARTRSIDRSIHESSSPRTLAVCIVLVPLPTRASVFTRHQPASDTVLLPATAMHATLLNGCYCRWCTLVSGTSTLHGA